MRLTKMEQMVVREAEEARARAMRSLEHGSDPIVLAQDFGACGELYQELGSMVATRVRAAEKLKRESA